ncbi:MAG: leucine/isoleucine/valine transporter permease subunit [Chloroflexi bacterium]|nr:leucine/isoleucine/valine transporter permease subunit [Chloroflexota bacterium]
MTAISETKPLATPTAVPAWFKQALKMGLIGGIIAVLIALEGMVQAFNTRDIVSGVVSMGIIIIFITYFATAYVAAAKSGVASPAVGLIIGALAGFIAALSLVVLIAVGQVINIGGMIISATPELYDLLTFKQGLTTGSLTILLSGLGIGLAAAIIYLLPKAIRQALLYGLVAVLLFGLLQDLVRVTLSDFDALTPIVKFLYTSNGLSNEGTIAVFVIFVLGSYLQSTRGALVQSRVAALPSPARMTLKWTGVVLGVVLLFLMPVLLGLYLTDVIDTVGIYLLMGLGLNIVVGFAGLLDLGYVAFWALGAYTVGILTSPQHATGIIHNWWLAAPFAIVVALFAGVVLGIPVLRMRGDYLAIVTLGFGEIIRLLAISDFLKPWEGGAQGIQRIPTPAIGPFQFVTTQLNLPILGQIPFQPQQMYYYVIIGGCLLGIFVASRVKISRLGRAWMAIREDEDVAQAMGINLVVTKLLAFGLGAAFGGLSGAILASKIQSVYPQSFGFLISANVLSLIILGGMGSIPGVIVGALALVGLPELLREVGDYRYLFYGAVLVVMMLVRPEGLLPEARRRMELEEPRAEEVSASTQEPVRATTTEP